MERLGPGAMAIIGGRVASRRNSDVEYRFRQASDLLYLTGFSEPDALAVLSPGRQPSFVLFVRPHDERQEIWRGRRAGLEGAVSQFGAERAFAIDDAKTELPRLLDGAEEVQFLAGEDRALDELVLGALADLRHSERRGTRAPTRIRDLRTSLHELRLIKDEDALAKLRRAAAITGEAHVAAMRGAATMNREYELEALIEYNFRRHGGLPGYGTIVGSGANGTILHYVDNSDPLKRGDLVLIDAGCEYQGFTADVTRTWPLGAPFSAVQRRVYDLVLEAQEQCIAAVRPGANLDELHALAVRQLTRGMVDLGLLSGSVDSLIESGSYKRFYMHRTSHWLGMDVHDVGAYVVEGKPRPLQAGMVLTIEPGLYIGTNDETAPVELRGIGVRIEDDVLVTLGGYEVLTATIPKQTAALEALTASHG